MTDDVLIDAENLLEVLNSKETAGAIKFIKRKTVFLITPDPFENHNKANEYLKYGFKASYECGRRNEAPILCYSFKLGMYGFNQWTLRSGPFSDQQLFDMQVSIMLKCHYVAVYGNEYTNSMNQLLNIAKINMPRIEFRSL